MAKPSSSNRALLNSLLKADTEADVIAALGAAGYWNDADAWRLYGDQEDNFSPAGSQQRNPEAALVEKLVNSVDACLMGRVLERHIDPRGPDAPRSPREAVAILFENAPPGQVHVHQGSMADWTRAQRTAVARENIALSVTGRTDDKPSITIADRGEGQSPDQLPHTILSLLRGIKKEIPFVQGKFNMGGTGALRFCGTQSLQLVLTKRNPVLARREGESDDWGFTVVRRDRPSGGTRVSAYRYLAPVGADQNPGHGEVLRIDNETLPVFPDGQQAYARQSEWGTLIKLYEYDVRAKSHVLRTDGLMGRLELLLPGLMLPIRVHECRGFGGKAGSFENTLTGLEVRLRGQEGDEGNLEEGFPDSGFISVRGQRIGVTKYAFRPGGEKAYKRSEGVLFVVNGQTHAIFPDRFFQRRSIGLGYLAKSLLVVLDCTDLMDDTREDLFMNSRDRLADADLALQIETELITLLRSDGALAKLANERRQAELTKRLEDSKPLEDVLKSILRRSPTLAKLFLTGTHLQNPFAIGTVSVAAKYVGKSHPTYFRFKDWPEGEELSRDCHLGQRVRLDFETDAANDYFRRAVMPGIYAVDVARDGTKLVVNDALNLHDGLAHLNLKLPDDAKAGDVLQVTFEILDETLVEPFVNGAKVHVRPGLQSRPGGAGERDRRNPRGPSTTREERPLGIELPEPHWVKKEQWEQREMGPGSGARVVSIGGSNGAVIGSYDYYLNADNTYLLAELKAKPAAKDVLLARFEYGLMLVAMSAVREAADRDKNRLEAEEDDESQDSEWSAENMVKVATDALAPVLLPAIEVLGALDISDIRSAGSEGSDDEDDELGGGEDSAI
jgi:hypothetical protein